METQEAVVLFIRGAKPTPSAKYLDRIAVTQLCRQIRAETRPMFFGRQQITIWIQAGIDDEKSLRSMLDVANSFLARLGSETLQLIPILKITHLNQRRLVIRRDVGVQGDQRKRTYEYGGFMVEDPTNEGGKRGISQAGCFDKSLKIYEEAGLELEEINRGRWDPQYRNLELHRLAHCPEAHVKELVERSFYSSRYKMYIARMLREGDGIFSALDERRFKGRSSSLPR